MTNREYYKEQILDVACNGSCIAFDKANNTICKCENLRCNNCEFQNAEIPCTQVLKEWAESEYVEPCPFEKDELVEVSDDLKEWRLGYFAHRSNERYYTFVHGNKSTEIKSTISWKYCRKYGTLGGLTH